MKVIVAIVVIILMSLVVQIVKGILKPSSKKENHPELKPCDRIVYRPDLYDLQFAKVLCQSGNNVRIVITEGENEGKELVVGRVKCHIRRNSNG